MIENKDYAKAILENVKYEIQEDEEYKNIAQEIQDLRKAGYQKIDNDENIQDKDSQKKEFDKLLKQEIIDKTPLDFSETKFNKNEDYYTSYSDYEYRLKSFEEDITKQKSNIGEAEGKIENNEQKIKENQDKTLSAEERDAHTELVISLHNLQQDKENAQNRIKELLNQKIPSFKEENEELIKKHNKQKIKFQEYLDSVFKQKPDKQISTYKDLRSENKFLRFIRKVGKWVKHIRKIVSYFNPLTRLFNWIFNKKQFLLGNKDTYKSLKGKIVKKHLNQEVYYNKLLAYLKENFPKNGITVFGKYCKDIDSFEQEIKGKDSSEVLININDDDDKNFKKIKEDFQKAELKKMTVEEKTQALDELAKSKNITRVEIPQGSGKMAQYRIIKPELENDQTPKGVVFFYHSNGNSIYNNNEEEMQKRFPGYIIVMPEYVGYPGSDGYSNKENVKKGLRELEEYILNNEDIVKNNIGYEKDVMFIGSSLGGKFAAKGARRLQESRDKGKINAEGKIHLVLANTYSDSMNAIPIVFRTIAQGLTYKVELKTNKDLKKIAPDVDVVCYHSSDDELFGNKEENAEKNLNTSYAINKNLIINLEGTHNSINWGKIVDKIESNNQRERVSIKRCLKAQPLNQQLAQQSKLVQ